MPGVGGAGKGSGDPAHVSFTDEPYRGGHRAYECPGQVVSFFEGVKILFLFLAGCHGQQTPPVIQVYRHLGDAAAW
jgi:hypothetical protein